MKTARATDIKTGFGQCLDTSMAEPVLIEKNGRPVAVMMSITDYGRLSAMEDEYWAMRAASAEKSGYIGEKAATSLLRSR
ncbi:MAG: type II toxin-antitoxin system Phd/YefM family antitoxin [Nitrospinae bacterium]|nr:type II toxin-antitoxin system Phd/YefM family antitoxin [Nitrospinota bacterium]